VQLAVCEDDLFSFVGATYPNPQGCTPTTPVLVDATGAATVPYQLDPDLQVTLDGRCGLTSWSYYASCSVIAFEGSPLLSVADAALHFIGTGAASVTGNVVDDSTGTPISDSTSTVSACLDGGSNCVSTNTTTGAYSVGSLPAGTYAIRATASPTTPQGSMSFDPNAAASGFSFMSNTVGVALGDHINATDVDVPLVPSGSTSGPIGYRGATVTVSPAHPAWNDAVTISGGGFRPGYEVNIGFCGSDPQILINNGHLSSCDGTIVVADDSGNASLTLPFTPDRFHGACSVGSCVAVAHETDYDGKGRWATVPFTPPTGTATISGTVTFQGAPVTGPATVTACGPAGCTSNQVTGSGFSYPTTPGAFSIPAPADGDYTLTASTYVGGNQMLGHLTVTVSNDQSISGVDLAVDDSALPTGSISGTVADADGDPLPGATVSGCQAYCPASTTTDAQGHYRLPYLADGSWTLHVTSNDVSFPMLVQTAAVTGGAETTGVDFTVPVDIGPGSIVAHFVDVHGVPLSGSIQACTIGGFPPTCWSSSGPISNPATIKYPPNGTYAVTGYADGAFGGTTATVSGGTTDLTITIPVAVGGGSIAGTVRDAGGHAIDAASVTFCANPMPGCSMAVGISTGPDGVYSRIDLPDGAYQITATAQNPFRTATTTVTIASGAHLTGVDFTLPDPTPVDLTPPTATATISPTPNLAGWVNAPATVTLDAADEAGGSGLASLTLGGATGTTSPLSTTVTADGTTTLAYSATDNAGNTTSDVVTVNVDQTAPTISITAPADGVPISQGSSATAAYTCDDATSGIASCVGSIPNGGAIDTSTTGITTLIVTATDNAGNVTTQTRTITVVPNTVPASKDHVALTFTGAIKAAYNADLNGHVRIRRTNGQVSSVTASGTVPGAAGGTATIRVTAQRLWILPFFTGTITVVDPSIRLSQTTPILGNLTASGSTVSGTSSWFTSRFAPYNVTWSVTDAG
jgi:hypothetical protein